MYRVELHTSDAKWIARNGVRPGRDGRTVIEVPDVEHLTFCGTAMVRFTLTDAPRDAMGQKVMQIPTTWMV